MKVLLIDPNEKECILIKEQIEKIIPYAQVEISHSAYDASIKARMTKFDIIFSEVYLPDFRCDIMLSFVDEKVFKIGMTELIAPMDIRRQFNEFILKPLILDELRRILMTASLQYIY